MARILVTGAAGFVGAALLAWLHGEGHDVWGTTTGPADGQIRHCDIQDRASVGVLMNEIDPEIVVHCAAISSVTSGQAIDYYAVNTVGTENLLNAFATTPSRKRFVFVSTAGVYGNQQAEVLHEDLRPRPVHHYGLSKLASELLLHNYSGKFETTVIRPFNIIGEGQNAEFIVPKLLRAFAARVHTVRLGNLDVYRDYIDILDAVKIISALALSDRAAGETVNLCSGSPVSINDLIEIFRSATNHDLRVEVAPEFVRANEVWRLLGDIRKLETILGTDLVFNPIDRTIRRMLTAISTTED